MKRFAIYAIIVIACSLLIWTWAHAQTALTLGAQLPATSCPPPTPGVTQACLTSDQGWLQSVQGAPYTAGAAPTSITVTINGVKKTCSTAAGCSFTVSASASAANVGVTVQ